MSAEDDREANSPDGHEARDAALQRAWRDASREASPIATDARILAAARAAVTAESKRDVTASKGRRWHVLQRWQPLLAAAAVAGLAFVLVPMTLSPPPPAERATAPSAKPEIPNPANPANPASSAESTESSESTDLRSFYENLPPAAPGASRKALESRDTTTAPGVSDGRSERAPAAQQPVPAQGVERAPEPAAVPPPPPASEPTFESAAPSGDRRAVESAAAAPLPQAREQAVDAKALDARSWAARIEASYRAKHLAAAAHELRAFRAVEPAADDYLPDELRDWARTVE